MVEPIFDLGEPLEQVTVFTPLGIRFWDPALDIQVCDGLIVTARPEGLRYPPITAFRTSSGIYAFSGLPGLHEVEYPSAPDRRPAVAARVLVTVCDGERRFLPAVFSVELPYQGVFPTGGQTSPLGAGPPGFYLFSAPTRPGTPALAVIRAQLTDQASKSAASYAVLEIQTPDNQTRYGLADERGCVAVLFPYPAFSGNLNGSSPVASQASMDFQNWPLTIRVRYEPPALQVPPGAQIPELRSIFRQSPGVMWTTTVVQPGQPVSQLAARLIFGQELVVRTEPESALWIGSSASVP